MPKKIKKQVKNWVKHESDDIEFLIKPFSFLYLTHFPTEETNYSPQIMKEIFLNSVLDWKGFVDEDGNDLKCTVLNKELVAEQADDLVVFVVNEALKAKQSIKEKEIKN